MKRLLSILSIFFVLLHVWGTAFAHSVKDVETLLDEKEQFFQAVDKDAPSFRLQDADGKAVTSSDLHGKFLVVNFIYTGCPDVCPLHAERIAEIQEMVNDTPMKEMVRFVTITTDPTNDAGKVLQDYGALHGLDPVNWMFLTTAPGQPEDTTRRLAEAFGHKFTKTDDGYQMHGIVTHVVDRDGRWRANFHGLRFSKTNFVVFLNALTNAQVPHAHKESNLWHRITDWFH